MTKMTAHTHTTPPTAYNHHWHSDLSDNASGSECPQKTAPDQKLLYGTF